jgi:hypothetical protein
MHYGTFLFSNGLTWNDMVMTVDILAVDAYLNGVMHANIAKP